MFLGLIFIFAPLVVGYLIPISTPPHLALINRISSYLIYLILTLMGLSLAALDNLMANIQTILQYTSIFFVVIGVCNLFSLTWIERLMPLATNNKSKSLSLLNMALESVKLILFVAAGLLVGMIFSLDLSWVEKTSEWILFFLLFLIGIQLRNSGLTLKQILLNRHGMAIAVTILLSSLIAGSICALLLDIPFYKALAMSSGFGWYSLSGILIGDAFGPVWGGVSFLLELLRELLALILIPLFIRRYPNTMIGYAGATALDFTLPIIQTTGGVRCVPIAIVSGFILSLSVPTLMLFFISLSS